MTSTTTEDLANLSDEDLTLRRDALALDARHDPELRAALDEAEAELGRRRRASDHDLAAAREQDRRDRAAALEREHTERETQARRLLALCADRIANARAIDSALDTLAEALGVEHRLRADSVNAAGTLGLPSYGLDLHLVVDGRVATAISDAGVDGSRPLSVGRWRRPLEDLLADALGGTTNQTAAAVATGTEED